MKSIPYNPRAVANQHPEDPRSEEVLIDRELKRLLEYRGIDLHVLADALLFRGLAYRLGSYPAKMAFQIAHNTVFELKQTDANPPIFSTAVAIGDAGFFGDELYVPKLLPATICEAVIGRRLGDLVATGISSLDDRRITRALRVEEDEWPKTRIWFDPDLVRLGPRRKALITANRPSRAP